MKRIISAVACAAAALAIATPAQAHGDLVRTVEGGVLVPTTRDSNSVFFAPPPGPIAKHARCAYLIAEDATGDGDNANGYLGYHFDIDPETEGAGDHTYSLESDKGNIAVYFYESLGECEGNAGSTGEGTEGPAGEEGQIPWFTAHAIVVVEDANDVSFTFNIYEPEEQPV